MVNNFSFLQAQIENYFSFVCFSLSPMGNTFPPMRKYFGNFFLPSSECKKYASVFTGICYSLAFASIYLGIFNQSQRSSVSKIYVSRSIKQLFIDQPTEKKGKIWQAIRLRLSTRTQRGTRGGFAGQAGIGREGKGQSLQLPGADPQRCCVSILCQAPSVPMAPMVCPSKPTSCLLTILYFPCSCFPSWILELLAILSQQLYLCL